ncbi:hypothetical protein RI367_005508 [Sorochytrium milnesiophthora]
MLATRAQSGSPLPDAGTGTAPSSSHNDTNSSTPCQKLNCLPAKPSSSSCAVPEAAPPPLQPPIALKCIYDDALFSARQQEADRNTRLNDGYKTVELEKAPILYHPLSVSFVRVVMQDRERPPNEPCRRMDKQNARDSGAWPSPSGSKGGSRCDTPDCDQDAYTADKDAVMALSSLSSTARDSKHTRFGQRQLYVYDTDAPLAASPTSDQCSAHVAATLTAVHGILRKARLTHFDDDGEDDDDDDENTPPLSHPSWSSPRSSPLPVVRVEVPQYKGDWFHDKRYRGITRILLRCKDAPDIEPTADMVEAIKAQSQRSKRTAAGRASTAQPLDFLGIEPLPSSPPKRLKHSKKLPASSKKAADTPLPSAKPKPRRKPSPPKLSRTTADTTTPSLRLKQQLRQSPPPALQTQTPTPSPEILNTNMRITRSKSHLLPA